MHWREGHVLAKIVFLCLCLVTNPESQNQIFVLFLRYFYGKPIINYIELMPWPIPTMILRPHPSPLPPPGRKRRAKTQCFGGDVRV